MVPLTASAGDSIQSLLGGQETDLASNQRAARGACPVAAGRSRASPKHLLLLGRRAVAPHGQRGQGGRDHVGNFAMSDI